MAITAFTTIAAGDIGRLTTAVNAKITADGDQPHGTPFFDQTSGMWTQAMVTVEEEAPE